MDREGGELRAHGGCVVIADDAPNNRELIRTLLEGEGYGVFEAADGREALDVISEHTPDVVVLDIVMPTMDGLEVCKRLKADMATAHIPVILVTAHHTREERLKGIDAGASDFLKKPVDLTDLRLRVRNAITTKRLYDSVQAEYLKVLGLETLRDELTHMIVHDLRSPLTSMALNLCFVQEEAEAVLDGEAMACLTDAVQSIGVLTKMITRMLDLSRLEAGRMPLHLQEHEIEAVVESAVRAVAAPDAHVIVSNRGPQSLSVSCDRDLMTRVTSNLVSNALDYSPSDQPVTVTIEAPGDCVRVTVLDRGPGIHPAFHEKIFEKFGQVEDTEQERRSSSGLGLAFCKLAVEAHGGTIGVESVVGEWTAFTFELPNQACNAEPSVQAAATSLGT